MYPFPLIFAPNKKVMLKLIVSILFVACGTQLYAQQKLKASDIIGTWEATTLLVEGKKIPLETDEAVKDYLFQQAALKSTGGATLSSEDSAGINMAAGIMGMFRQSSFVFNANKSFKFSLTMGNEKDNKGGTWALNEATQTIRISEIKMGKPVKSEIVKIIVKGSQLLVQMEKDKEEGFLIRRKK
jgi:hypothetical protein